MSALAAHVLAVLLFLAPWHHDRGLTPEQRVALLTPVATAIVHATQDRQEIAFLVAQGWHESKFAGLVLQGRCTEMPRDQRCDPDRHGRPQSVGPWQVKGRWCRGADTLEGQAACVLKLARLGRKRCKGSWEAAFAAQRGAGVCESRQAPRRYATMRDVTARMNVELQKAAQRERDQRGDAEADVTKEEP